MTTRAPAATLKRDKHKSQRMWLILLLSTGLASRVIVVFWLTGKDQKVIMFLLHLQICCSWIFQCVWITAAFLEMSCWTCVSHTDCLQRGSLHSSKGNDADLSFPDMKIAALWPAAGIGSLRYMRLVHKKENTGMFSVVLSLLHLTGQWPRNSIQSPAQTEAFEKNAVLLTIFLHSVVLQLKNSKPRICRPPHCCPSLQSNRITSLIQISEKKKSNMQWCVARWWCSSLSVSLLPITRVEWD